METVNSTRDTRIKGRQTSPRSRKGAAGGGGGGGGGEGGGGGGGFLWGGGGGFVGGGGGGGGGRSLVAVSVSGEKKTKKGWATKQ